MGARNEGILYAGPFRIELLHTRRSSDGWRRSIYCTSNYFQISQSFQSYHEFPLGGNPAPRINKIIGAKLILEAAPPDDTTKIT